MIDQLKQVIAYAVFLLLCGVVPVVWHAWDKRHFPTRMMFPLFFSGMMGGVTLILCERIFI